jgi:hypothetical protein
LELDVDLVVATVVVVAGCEVVVSCARVVVVAATVVVVVGAVVGGTVVVVVGAKVVVVTGAVVVVVVSWAAATPERTPNTAGVTASERRTAAVRRRTFGCIGPAYDQRLVRRGDPREHRGPAVLARRA